MSTNTQTDAPATGVALPNRVWRILVVDDHRPTRMASSIHLRKRGCEVEEAADGNAAMRAFFTAVGERRPFDLILLDLHMPGASGGRAMIELLEARPRPRVIVCTGDTENALVKDHRYYGFDGRMVKPFSLDALWGEIERVMR